MLASLPYFVAGFLDQPTGPLYADSDLTVWSIIVVIGHALMALTVLAFVGLLVTSIRGTGGDAVDGPVNGHTLEWATTSPAPADNFAEQPTVMSAEPMVDHMKPADDTGSDA